MAEGTSNSGEVHVGTLPVISADSAHNAAALPKPHWECAEIPQPGKKPTSRYAPHPAPIFGRSHHLSSTTALVSKQHLERIFAPFRRQHGRGDTEEPASASQSVKRLPNATAERPTAHTLIALQTGVSSRSSP